MSRFYKLSIPLLFAALLSFSVIPTAIAQDSRAADKDTPAPKGYKAFYISHVGLHAGAFRSALSIVRADLLA